MSPQLLDGRAIAAKLYDKIRHDIQTLSRPRPPGLAVIQVGNDPASASYIRQKSKAALNCGFRFEHVHLPSEISEQQLLSKIDEVAADTGIDGMILQLPLDSPALHKVELIERFLDRIPPDKDADGLHAVNLGRLFASVSTSSHWTSPLPATAYGVMLLLAQTDLKISGIEAVVVGRSRLVGMPAAALLTHAGATVTLCHSKTHDLMEHTRRAQLLVVAAGRKHLIGPAHIKDGAIVIDVGIHPDGEPGSKKLTGDVSPEAHSRTRAYTPVPGGVGPMTVAGLLENTFRLWKARGV